MPSRHGLLPLELAILRIVASAGDVHGFAIARELRAAHGGGLTAHGTLYKALARLAAQGLLVHRWEAPEPAVAEGRPRRRLYRITDAGETALAAAEDAARRRPVPGMPRTVTP
jgi:PadR family transcriptional regulator, regulatory protein PadR